MLAPGMLLDTRLPQPPGGAIADWEVVGPSAAFVPHISPRNA